MMAALEVAEEEEGMANCIDGRVSGCTWPASAKVVITTRIIIVVTTTRTAIPSRQWLLLWRSSRRTESIPCQTVNHNKGQFDLAENY